jgi:hypothetical protein
LLLTLTGSDVKTALGIEINPNPKVNLNPNGVGQECPTHIGL